MKLLTARLRRRNLIIAALLALASATLLAATLAVGARAVDAVVTPFDLWGVRLSRGQLQFLHGFQMAYRYNPPKPGLDAAHVGPYIQHVAWDATTPPGSPETGLTKPELEGMRLMLHNWPPLAEHGSMLVGGQVSFPIANPDGTEGVDWREFGWRVNGRAMAAWPVTLLLALLAGWFGWRSHRASIPPGGCRHCGYDLRASPERCPECGRETAEPIAS